MRLVLERLPLHIHTAMLEVVVVIGGAVMIFVWLEKDEDKKKEREQARLDRERGRLESEEG